MKSNEMNGLMQQLTKRWTKDEFNAIEETEWEWSRRAKRMNAASSMNQSISFNLAEIDEIGWLMNEVEWIEWRSGEAAYFIHGFVSRIQFHFSECSENEWMKVL